jgi:putative acetyltransferase
VAVDQARSGRGVGSRLMAAAIDLADNWFNLMRLELLVRADNTAAIQLYRKFGFSEEGILRAYGYRNGRYMDCMAMARMRG